MRRTDYASLPVTLRPLVMTFVMSGAGLMATPKGRRGKGTRRYAVRGQRETLVYRRHRGTWLMKTY